jgi:5-(carboxyamino)imidazole ribonucleotide mutase
MPEPAVSILMGSKSDWEVMKAAADTLTQFGISNESKVLSAHRTPKEAVAYIEAAEGRGTKVIIAAAGGAAHLAGVCAAHTTLPVLGVPMLGWSVDGLDALLSTVQMPPGIPVGTLAIGKPGAINAALLAVSIIALGDPALKKRLLGYRDDMRAKILSETLA